MKRLSTIAVALTLLGTSAALAQYNGNYANRNESADQQHNDNQQGRDQGRNDDQGRYQSQGQNEVRDNPHWSRGDRLSSEYRNNQYVVSDWRGSHLRQPPRGYHWVRANNQYVLAAVATGVIADIIMMSNQRDQRSR